MQNILLQTTIEHDPDDWNIARFSRLREFLSQLRGKDGQNAFRVIARDRSGHARPDPVLSNLHEERIDQLWLFAVDGSAGLHAEDCAGIRRFRQLGGGLVVTCGHLGAGGPVPDLGGVEAAYHMHGAGCGCADPCDGFADNCPTAVVRAHSRSGAHGDFQRVRPTGHIHPVMRDRHSATGVIQYLPAHPHENAVRAPPGDASARVIMEGQSLASVLRFNLAVAFERSEHFGRAIAQSSFHHFADFNWDTAAGRPSFEWEPVGEAMARFPEALRSTKQYISNIAFWLGA